MMLMVKNSFASAEDGIRDSGLISGSGRSPGCGNDNPLLDSCLGNSTDRGAWQATVHGGLKESDTTEQQSTHEIFHCVYRLHVVYPFTY